MLKHEVDELREIETQVAHDRIAAGHGKHHAELPPVRFFGPLLPIRCTRGLVVPTSDNRHPFGPQNGNMYVHASVAASVPNAILKGLD